MSEWKEYKLGDLTDVVTKGTTPSTIGGGFISEGVNFIKSEAVCHDGRIDRSTFVHISEETHQKLKRSQLQKDDILFSMAGIFLGKNAVVTEDILPANTNQALAIIRLNKKKSLPRFISYYLRQESVVELVNNMSGQSAQPNINFEEIKSIDIKLPSLSEQNAIAEVLTSLDDKIDLLHRQNKTLEQLAETLFRQWFVEEINESWQLGRVNSLIKLQSGFPFKSSEFVDSGKYKLITIKNVQDGYMDTTKADLLNNIPDRLPEYCILKTGDILLSLTGNVGRCCLVDEKNLLLNQRVVKLKPLNNRDWAFTYVMFRQNSMRRILEELAKGTAQANLSPIETGEMEIQIPPIELLDKYSEKATSLIQKVLYNKFQIRALIQLRDTLLPSLMSGEIEIK